MRMPKKGWDFGEPTDILYCFRSHPGKREFDVSQCPKHHFRPIELAEIPVYRSSRKTFDAAVGVAGDPSICYAGAASGGIFKTIDGGVSWEPIFDDQPVSSASALAVAPSIRTSSGPELAKHSFATMSPLESESSNPPTREKPGPIWVFPTPGVSPGSSSIQEILMSSSSRSWATAMVPRKTRESTGLWMEAKPGRKCSSWTK